MYRPFHCLYYTLLLDVCQGLFYIFPLVVIEMDVECKHNGQQHVNNTPYEIAVDCTPDDKADASTEKDAILDAVDGKSALCPRITK